MHRVMQPNLATPNRKRRCRLSTARDFLRRLHRTRDGSAGARASASTEQRIDEEQDAPPASAQESSAAEYLSAPQDFRPPSELVGLPMPTLLFATLDHVYLDLRALAGTGLVLYVYPGCGDPGSPEEKEDRLRHRTFAGLRHSFADAAPGVAIVALTSLNPLEQFRRNSQIIWSTMEQHAGCPHHLVPDETWQAAQELGLPTFELEGRSFYEPVTIIARGYRIRMVFHPADKGQDPHQALAWLRAH